MATIGQAFEAMEWHDAVLLRLDIDRGAPGDRDEVAVVIEWPNGRRQHLLFTDCYAFDAQMQFGVIAPEAILSAQCVASSPRLSGIRQRWRSLGVELDDLVCFEITTNSTASVLRVCAKGFEISEL